MTRWSKKSRDGRSNSSRLRDYCANFAFVIPFLIVYALFVLYPIVQAAMMSFFQWDLLGNPPQWEGPGNYVSMLGGQGLTWSLGANWEIRLLLLIIAVLICVRRLRSASLHSDVTQKQSILAKLGSGTLLVTVTLVVTAVLMGIHPGEGGAWNDPRFWNALYNTLIFTLISSPLIAGLGLLFALLLHRKHRLTGVYRALLFIPYVLPVSVTTLIWGYLLNPSRGLVARLTDFFGAGVINWLSDPRFAMAAIIITTVWWTVGFNMIIFEAGLQDIDPSLYEAASLDGANAFQQFRSITVPGLSHATMLVVVTQIIASFQIFGQVNIMTAGGPAGSTDVLVRYIYATAFRDTELGYASAMSLVLFMLMVFVSLNQFLLAKETEK